MEEKERYEYFFGTNTVKDNKTNQFYGCVVDLLNQQDKRIKELEQQNLSLQEQSIRDNQNWIEETTQLKQQLAEKNKEIEKLNACVKFYKSYYISFNEKVIDELEKVKRYIDDKAYYVEEENFGIEINEYIDNQIEELKKDIK